MHYKFENGSYYLMDGENILYMGEEISIAFSHDGEFTVMHKHGSPALVTVWLRDAQNSIRQTSIPEFADEFRMVTSNQWKVEDLNQMLDNALFFHRFMAEHNLLDGVPLVDAA